jgi:hypothetical protein
MIWVVDKTVTRHLLTSGTLLAELPLRISFEYAVESGRVVNGSLSIEVLYNSRAVSKVFPEIEAEQLNEDVGKTANDAVIEHLAMNGLGSTRDEVEPVVIAAH